MVQVATGWKRFRYLALAGGSFAMTVAALVIPGLPTVPCLLATSYYLARSSPRLDRMLRRTAFFGPILTEWEQHHALSGSSKRRLMGLTVVLVVITVALTPLTPVALVVILVVASLSILGVFRLPALSEGRREASRLEQPAGSQHHEDDQRTVVGWRRTSNIEARPTRTTRSRSMATGRESTPPASSPGRDSQMKYVVVILGAIVVAASPIHAGAQSPRAAESQPTTAETKRQGPSSAETALRAVDEAFVRDYNKGDSKALAAYFTEDAEVIAADGERLQGRNLIEQRFVETFETSPGVKIALEIEGIRFLNPDTAKEEGRTLMTPAKGAPVYRIYTVLFVKRDARWLISSIREEADPLVRPHERLKDLEWMIGEWIDEGIDSEVRVDCRWSDDTNYLIRTFTVKRQGKPVMTVSQRIGWDPLARQIRSWEFDSEGGFGEGRWSRDGDRWIIKHTGVRPEGTTASSTNTMWRERPDLVRWTSTDRILGDEPVPNEETYVLVRVPPPPRSRSKAQATPSPSPNTTRSPR